MFDCEAYSINPRVQVVTAFLTDGYRIAVFKRSTRVGTYSGLWAGVSGYVERLPLSQALVEIAEETGLSRESLQLAGIGIPVSVDDADTGRRWLVFPFLFKVADPAAVRIDWEATQVEWVNPNALHSLPTVPGLDKALASVWPPIEDPVFWQDLESIALDTNRGATSLGVSGLRAVDRHLRRSSPAEQNRTGAACALAACRPSMGVFANLAAEVLLREHSIPEMEHRLAQASRQSALNAAEALNERSRVLTNSFSSCVRDALRVRSRLPGSFEVVVMESRPGMEGVRLAESLAGDGITVSVITDAQAAIWANRVDAALVGCDAILPDDCIQNKAGTSLLAMAARAAGIPCLAITQTFKIMPPGFPHVVEEQDPESVGNARNVKFRNLVFDTTPLELFDAVYVENGVLTGEQLSAIRARLGAAKLVD